MATQGVLEGANSVEIKIKTLDCQTYNLRVDKCVPVPQLKEKIADLTGIESAQQRLICRGKVLADNDNLSQYHVEDGHTLHLVVRQPPEGSSRNPGAGNASETVNNQNISGSESVVLEAINVEPRRGFNIGQIISSIISSFGAGGPQGLRAEAGGTNDESAPSDSNPNPNSSFRVEIGSMQAPSETSIGSLNPSPIPDSFTTMSQYLDFMNEEFRRAGFGSVDIEPFGHGNGMHNVSNLSQAAHSTRMVMAQARGCLFQLGEQLANESTMNEESSRAQVQALSMRSGVLMQNLGSLLLELGRAAMMFHAGPTPQEASVNAGPAVFISGNGPNPLMVQPVPFFPGSSSLAGLAGGVHSVHTGGVHSGHSGGVHSGHPGGVHSAHAGGAVRSRSIDIHIRTGRVVPVSTGTDSGEQHTAGAQAQEQTDPTGNPSSPVQGLTGEQGMRSLPMPIRMVAVPVFARVPAGRRENNNNAQPERNVQGNGSEEPFDDDFSTMLNELLGRALNGQPIHSSPVTPSIPSPPPRDSVQVAGGSSEATNEEGVRFANILRQVLPAVSSSQQGNYLNPLFEEPDPARPPRIIRINRRQRSSNQARGTNDSNNADNDSNEGTSSKRQRNNEN